jgi:hypothetical protein
MFPISGMAATPYIIAVTVRTQTKKVLSNFILCTYTQNTICNFNVHGSVHRKNILIYIRQDVTLHSLFYQETSTHHQERKQLYLQHLVFVTPVLLRAAAAAGSSSVLCAPDDGWWYNPKHVVQFPHKINCVTLHLAGPSGRAV